MDDLSGLNVGWPIIGAAILPFVFSALLYWASQHSPAAPWCRDCSGLVAPFFAAISILFALFAAFLGNDVWERVRTGTHSLEQEFSAVSSISHIAAALGDEGQAVRSNARRYVEVTLEAELSGSGVYRSVAADRALRDLLIAILSLESSRSDIAVLQNAMLSDHERVSTARGTRRNIAETHSDPHKWAAVIILGFLTQLALTLNHVEKPRPLIAALTVFSLAFATVLVTLRLHERPVASPPPETLQQIQEIGR